VPGAIEVTLVGGESTALHVFLALAGSVVIAAAAVAAAMIARKTANERQQEQLAHDTLRQERALEHDREMRDRDFLRQTVSSALENAISTTEAISGFKAKVSQAEERRRVVNTHAEDEESEEHVEAWKALVETMGEVAPAMDEAHRASIAALTDNVRLRSLLGENSPVVKAHLKLVHAYRDWFDTQTSIADGTAESEDEQAKASLTVDATAPLLKDFERACRDHFEGAAR
jgi:hypothetical protein